MDNPKSQPPANRRMRRALESVKTRQKPKGSNGDAFHDGTRVGLKAALAKKGSPSR